jgi:hypothetical protein
LKGLPGSNDVAYLALLLVQRRKVYSVDSRSEIYSSKGIPTAASSHPPEEERKVEKSEAVKTFQGQPHHGLLHRII